jgi:type II secretory pathway pseudopilin PulG
MKLPALLPRRGFLLLEMVLALAVFGMAATGFVVALHRMSAAASLAQSELRITRILDSALDETLSLPLLEEGQTNTTVGEPASSWIPPSS